MNLLAREFQMEIVMTDKRPDPESDAARSDPDLADRNRKELAKKAEEGMKNANDELPKDQI